MSHSKPLITNLTLNQLNTILRNLGEPSFRFQQIVKWIYQKRVDRFDAMRNVPKDTRKKLAEKYSITKLPVCSLLESKKGDAVKFGFAAGSGDDIIESVLLYDGTRRSLCLSSQLGCGLGCAFCETGRMGFIRNLTLHEITGQLIAANDYCVDHSDRLVSNIIFMGMGEALANFDTFLSAVDILMHEHCFGIGGRKITVSTAGIVPGIEKLMRAGKNINLAISLNTYNNEKRDAIMPMNKKYPLEKLIQAARAYHTATGSTVTFEYVCIQGENDTAEAAVALQKLFHGVPGKINLIPLNPYTNGTLQPSEDSRINRFAQQLVEGGLQITVRKSRGQDISGACGQLAGKYKS